jgi:hypothetical protein
METAGKVLLVSAVVLAIAGLGALGLAKLGIDRVPGTLSWKSDNVTVFVPIGLMLLISIVGTIVVNVFLRRWPTRRSAMNTVRPRRDPGRGYAYGGPALIGGILVGLGLGILLDNFFAWLVIGIGAGFILMGFIAALGK